MYRAGKERPCARGAGWRKAGMQGWEAWGQTGQRSVGGAGDMGQSSIVCGSCSNAADTPRVARAQIPQELVPAACVFSLRERCWWPVVPVTAAAGGRACGTPGCAAGQARWAAAGLRQQAGTRT